MTPKLLTLEHWSLNFYLLNSKYHSFVLVDVQKGNFLRWHCRPKTSSNCKIHFFGLVIKTFAPFNHSVPTTPLTGNYSILRNWKEKLYHGTSFFMIQKGNEKRQDKLTNWKPGWSNFIPFSKWIGLMKELCSKRGIFSKNIKTESNSLPP